MEEQRARDVTGPRARRAEARRAERDGERQDRDLIGGEAEPGEPACDVAGVATDEEGGERRVVGLHRAGEPDALLVDGARVGIEDGAFVGGVGETRDQGSGVHPPDGELLCEGVGELGQVDQATGAGERFGVGLGLEVGRAAAGGAVLTGAGGCGGAGGRGKTGEDAEQVRAGGSGDGEGPGSGESLRPRVADGPTQGVQVPDVAAVDQSDRARGRGRDDGGEIVDHAGVHHVVAEHPQLPGHRKVTRLGGYDGPDEERGRQRHHLCLVETAHPRASPIASRSAGGTNIEDMGNRSTGQ